MDIIFVSDSKYYSNNFLKYKKVKRSILLKNVWTRWGYINNDEYKVEIDEILRKNPKGEIVTEIWARIINTRTNDIIKKMIWWKNGDGVFHDESKDLPIKFRDIIDNAWLHKFR